MEELLKKDADERYDNSILGSVISRHALSRAKSILMETAPEEDPKYLSPWQKDERQKKRMQHSQR